MIISSEESDNRAESHKQLSGEWGGAEGTPGTTAPAAYLRPSWGAVHNVMDSIPPNQDLLKEFGLEESSLLQSAFCDKL